jgi:hypothetical protein
MSTEIQVVEQGGRVDLFDASPSGVVERATEVANALVDVIEGQKLYTEFQGNKHVRVEGWQTLGSMLGILPEEEKVIKHEDGTFEAYVKLLNVKTGMVVGAGSGMCGADEKNWASKPMYARRSMAVTRATGKAYRQAFGWIMCLKGYKPTPAEEMDGLESAPVVTSKVTPKKSPAKAPSTYQETKANINALKDIFDSLGVTDGDLMNKVHAELVEEKTPLENLQKVVEEKLGMVF